MKIITFYLPQFHEIEFNNTHHEQGFTEWTSLSRSKPLYEGHNAPRIPLDDNYYNLEDDKVKAWQIKLAKRGGVYGFCMYHYWSGGELLLERPVEQWLKNKSLDFPFCLSWANHPWSQHLTGGNRKLIRDQNTVVKKSGKRTSTIFCRILKTNDIFAKITNLCSSSIDRTIFHV